MIFPARPPAGHFTKHTMMNINNNQQAVHLPLYLILKRLRKEAGIVQAEIAEQLRVTSEAVAQWERGHRRPCLDKLPRLAKILGIEPRALCLWALAEFHPCFYDAVFGAEERRGSVAA